ncbi:MAG: nucleotidyltransferase domain-containing protein [Thermodesulfobacteriota bacterium]
MDSQAVTADRLQPVLARYPELVFGLLFGSAARGEAEARSDIDLAFFVREPKAFPFARKLALHADCCRALARRELDLVILNQSRNLLLAEQIVREGRTILNRDQEALDDYAVRVVHSIAGQA